MIDTGRIQIDPNGVARWSPDGVGYYYDSIAEAIGDHPNFPNPRMVRLSESFDEYDERTERY